ncbi:MAG TPA: SAM-dependent methyltransferase [Candidatus Acidoferrum sp.]|nr:SAM-dependent methyltransferase [Candidatus Acidoferrum sp.]
MKGSAPRPARTGSLTIVGTGIAIGQMTVEAREYIKSARHIVALVADPVTLAWVRQCNPHTESLQRFYAYGKDRRTTYADIVEYVLGLLRRGRHVCFVLYGHPGVFALPPHELMRRARREGIPAAMLAGVSAEDCLFADLGVDPGTSGCQSFEATDFLVRRRKFDPCSALILWQFGVVGEASCPKAMRRDCVRMLAERLAQTYPPDHEVILYEAAVYPFCNPVRRHVRLSRLARTRYLPMCTLFVPPLPDRRASTAMIRRLRWE